VNQTTPSQTKPSQITPSQTAPSQTKPSQTKPNNPEFSEDWMFLAYKLETTTFDD